MKLTEILLFGVAGWSSIGVVGVTVSKFRGERQRVRQGVAWLAGVWVVYLGVLLGVSLTQGEHVVAMGQPQCFGEMCFTVTGVEEVPGFLIRDGRRLLRVSVQVANRGRSMQRESSMKAYLMDAQGRRWDESAGIGGVRLDARVTGGGAVVSESVFKVAGDATGLRLVLTRGRWQPGVLTIGDSDSLLHKRTVVPLRR